MTLHALFATHVYTAALPKQSALHLNRQLLKEARQLREDDASGRRWSRRNYPGGYTSYGSVHRLHQVSPTFAALERQLNRHVSKFAAELAWDLANRELKLTDCWVNMMPPGTVHSSHLHPLSSISGTYYVQVPRGSPGLKFEDPRLDKFMAAPPRKPDAVQALKPWVTFTAAAGQLLLFESWLRHEVVPNQAAAERVSISFNYNWF
jgi:uncharacterized protein (TIGR02466 family)